MDVNFGESVKEYLLRRVNLIQIHRFSPEDMQFTDALVTSSIVIFKNEQPNEETSVIFSQGGTLKNPIESKKFHDKDMIIKIWEILNRISPNNLIREGRVYGGGLYKLEPSELLRTPVKEMAEFVGHYSARQPTLF